MKAIVYYLDGRVEQYLGSSFEIEQDYPHIFVVYDGGHREKFSLQNAFKIEVIL